MNSCQISYVLALIVCVGGWIGLFYYCFKAPEGYKGLCPEDVPGRTWRAPKKPKSPLSELDKLLIKPEGVESPIHEICAAILENLDNKRFLIEGSLGSNYPWTYRMSNNTCNICYRCVTIVDKVTDVTIKLRYSKDMLKGELEETISDVSVNAHKITLCKAEEAYIVKVYLYVSEQLDRKYPRLTKLKEQRHRRAITKLYSEV